MAYYVESNDGQAEDHTNPAYAWECIRPDGESVNPLSPLHRRPTESSTPTAKAQAASKARLAEARRGLEKLDFTFQISNLKEEDETREQLAPDDAFSRIRGGIFSKLKRSASDSTDNEEEPKKAAVTAGQDVRKLSIDLAESDVEVNENFVDSDREPSEQDHKVADDLEQQYSEDTPYETEMDAYAKVLREIIKEKGAKTSDVQQALELLYKIVHDHKAYDTLDDSNINYQKYLLGYESRLKFLELLGYNYDYAELDLHKTAKMRRDKELPLTPRTQVWTLINEHFIYTRRQVQYPVKGDLMQGFEVAPMMSRSTRERAEATFEYGK